MIRAGPVTDERLRWAGQGDGQARNQLLERLLKLRHQEFGENEP